MNDPKKISPSDRVRQYPDEPFEVSAGKFFCGACREEVSTKSSIISQHIKSAKHKISKEKRVGSALKDTSIVSALEAYDKAIHPVGEQLPLSTQLFRVSMHDRASVNVMAILSIAVLFSKMFDIGCYSHTLDRVGEKMNTPLLDEFISSWVSMFSCSPKTKLLWATKTGLSSPTYSSTRWWSKFEVIKQVHDMFAFVESFLRNENLGSATSGKMLKTLNNAGSIRKFKIELAMTVDGMMPFVKATYNLEGDGLLSVYNCLQRNKHPFCIL